MTEQEQIKEMASLMRVVDCLQFNGSVDELLSKKNYASALYNAGYRKSDEVRKETAKDVAYKAFELMTDCKNGVEAKIKLSIFMKEKYGDEVEE